MATHATTCTDRSACIEETSRHDVKSKLWSNWNIGTKPLSEAKMGRGGLTGHGSAIQYNVTKQCRSLNEHLPKTRTLFLWSTPRLLAIHGLVHPSCEVLAPFIRCNIHPNVLHGGACTESELGRSLLHKKVYSKTLSLNITIKINGNQTFERKFNTIEFNEASMQNQDFGEEFTVRVVIHDGRERKPVV
jgi:hypothetical protein